MPFFSKLKRWIGSAALGIALASSPVKAEVNKEYAERAQANQDRMFGIRMEEQNNEETPRSDYKMGLELKLKNPLETKQAGNYLKFSKDIRMPGIPGAAEVVRYDASEFINPEIYGTELGEYNKRQFDAKKWFLELPAYSLGALTATVFWHELGHARNAFYYGCKKITMHGPQLDKGIFVSVSCRSPKSHGLSSLEMNIFSIAGVDATSTMSNYLYQSLKTGAIPESMKPFAATTALFMMADRHSYLWSGAIRHYLGYPRPGHDFMIAMNRAFSPPLLDGHYIDAEGFDPYGSLLPKGGFYTQDDNSSYHEIPAPYVDPEGRWRTALDPDRYMHIAGKACKDSYGNDMACYFLEQPNMKAGVQRQIDIAYGVALGMSVLELGLRFNEINYLVGTALGGNPKAPEGFEVIKAGFYPIEGGFFVSIDGQW